jgi:hypothetical protein
MNQWALPTIAALLLGYGALSGRLQSTVVTQARVPQLGSRIVRESGR